ncbi:unnamed protein product [Protopolystoma xenopodis]|uniref:Kinesin-like protein n=1 Tax=Protopolystoma xenopodis TaxID=117903 RepID=A0A448XQ09_9PLAT|nr:unnamed protein product [Protopolystoma xenopodis]
MGCSWHSPPITLRPLKNSEQTADFSLDKQTLFFSGKEFTFDHVFGQTASQHKVFSAAVKPLVSRFHAQVYNDDLRDLLSPDNVSSGVQIRDRGNNQVEVTGLTTHEVTGSDEVTLHLLPPQILRFLFIGGHARKTACTHMNATSSRSHAIFTIKLKFSRVGEVRIFFFFFIEPGYFTISSFFSQQVNERVTSKINFVDLAGSESLKRTGAEGERAKEGININMGLLALGNVINSLSEGRVHIPYRSSKLTRLLSDSIGGNSKTLFIACISPAKEDKHETLNTLLYASRVKRIHNRAVQQITSENEVISLKAEIVWLRKQLEVFQVRLAIATTV